MNLPPIEEWLTMQQASKVLGVPIKRVYNANSDGRMNRSGQIVKLETWKTVRGIVTTRAAIDAFHRKLNG